MLMCLNTGLCAGLMPMEERKVLEMIVACKAALDIPLTRQEKAGGSRSKFLCFRQELFCSLPLTELWEAGDVSSIAELPQALLQKSPVSVYKIWEALAPQRGYTSSRTKLQLVCYFSDWG